MTNSWLSKNGNEIDEEVLMKLYEVHYRHLETHISSFQKNMNLHITIIFALLTAFVTGVLQFYREPIALILIGIPCFMAFFAQIGKKTIDRLYRGFLESVVIVAKIENILGLDGNVSAKKSNTRKSLWNDDKTFLLDRWVKDRYECQSSVEFISKRRQGGIFQYANRVFNVLEYTGLILAFSSLLILLHVHAI